MSRRYLVITELFLPTKGGSAVWFDEVYRRLSDRSTHITALVPDCETYDRNHANTGHRLHLYHSRWLRQPKRARTAKCVGSVLLKLREV